VKDRNNAKTFIHVVITGFCWYVGVNQYWEEAGL